MSPFLTLLRRNHNYRNTWLGQVVSEVGDHFNNVAVFSLALKLTGSGLVVTGVMLSRAIPAILAGPLAGVLLDRVNVGFAALQMNKDLGLTPAMFGFAASLFFVSYFLVEVPSNLALQKFGARRWIGRPIRRRSTI